MRSIGISILQIVSALLVVSVVAFVVSATIARPQAGTLTTAFSDGNALFESYCKSCHSTSSIKGGGIGPDLSEIGRIAASRRDGMGANEYLLESIVSPSAFVAPGAQAEMPTGFGFVLKPDQIKSLVWLLANQGASADVQAVRSLKIPTANSSVDVEDSPVRHKDAVLRGKALFFGKGECGRCHSILPLDESFSLLGPGLFGIGRRASSTLRSDILEPSKELNPTYLQVSVDLADGSHVDGVLLKSDDRETLLAVEDSDGTGHVRTISAADIRVVQGSNGIRPTGRSSMPDDYQRRLTTDEVDDVVSFVKTLY